MRSIGLALCLAQLLLLTAVGAASAEAKRAVAVLAGGCFWCIEHDLAPVPGVVDVMSGYAGGSRPAPTYDDYNAVNAEFPVPHIEVVQVTYDPAVLSYDRLLDVFLHRIDPTDGGGQFCDRGPAYRPAVFVADAAERKAAKAELAAVGRELAQPAAVAILDAAPFWPAEAYHQDYAVKNPVRYKYYRWNCGRDQRLEALWDAPSQ